MFPNLRETPPGTALATLIAIVAVVVVLAGIILRFNAVTSLH